MTDKKTSSRSKTPGNAGKDLKIVKGDEIHGDKVAGNKIVQYITQVIHQVDVNFLKRVGLELRVGIALLALLIVGSSVGLFFALRNPVNDDTPKEFNIAVTGFTETGEKPVESASTLTNFLVQRLNTNLADALGPSGKLVPRIIEPNNAGTIDIVCSAKRESLTEAETKALEECQEKRAIKAAEIAEKKQVDMVIYGEVRTFGGRTEIAPKFYLNGANFQQAGEITGDNELGTPIEVVGRDAFAARQMLEDRIRFLSQIVQGLRFLSGADYTNSLLMLQKTESGSPCAGIRKQCEQTNQCGKNVPGVENSCHFLYLLMGNASIMSRDVDQAKTYFTLSSKIAPDYSRAFIGLGNVYSTQAISGTINTTLLVQALDMYDRALKAKKPPASDIETKVHFGLGSVYLELSLAGNTTSIVLAKTHFQSVIADYGNGKNPRVRDLAAESHARLGFIYRKTSEYTGDAKWLVCALDEYKIAVRDLSTRERRAVYEPNIQDLEKLIATKGPLTCDEVKNP